MSSKLADGRAFFLTGIRHSAPHHELWRDIPCKRAGGLTCSDISTKNLHSRDSSKPSDWLAAVISSPSVWHAAFTASRLDVEHAWLPSSADKEDRRIIMSPAADTAPSSVLSLFGDVATLALSFRIFDVVERFH